MAILIAISAITLFAAKVEVTVEGVAKFWVNDPTGMKEWNGKYDDDCRCWNGNNMDCSFESLPSKDTKITTSESGNEFTFSGSLDPIEVEVTDAAGNAHTLDAQSTNFTTPVCYFVVPANLIPGVSGGVIIDIPSFTTDQQGNYTVVGTLRP